MGIFCEINLCRPADGKYTYQPGSVISGEIRYYLHEEYEFTAITVSLKGQGHLHIRDNNNKRRRAANNYTNDEIYIDVNNVIYANEKRGPLPVGQYERRFNFQLPYNIPPSTDFVKTTYDYYVHCCIKYYIQIKFERPGFFKSDKRYEKELNVISEQIPRLTTEPLIYGEQKNLLQLGSLFSNKKGIVNLKATIVNSVLRPGESVKLDYEINNDTNKTIKDVQIRMFEVDKYTIGGDEIRVHTEIGGVGGVIHEAISGGDTATFTTDIPIPKNCLSIDHCKFLSRDYSVVTFVRLPDPHVNMPIEIPFQIINVLSSGLEDIACCSRVDYARDDPPSYWEAMGEDTRFSLENQV